MINPQPIIMNPSDCLGDDSSRPVSQVRSNYGNPFTTNHGGPMSYSGVSASDILEGGERTTEMDITQDNRAREEIRNLESNL